MRSILLPLLLLLAGCAAPSDRRPAPPNAQAGRRPTPSAVQPARPILEKLRLTLDIRYRLGETLSPDTRVTLVGGTVLIGTALKACGTTPDGVYVRYTTGGTVQPGQSYHVLLTPPGEPSQVFDITLSRKPGPLGAWSDWRPPASQIVSPMPAQALLNQPGARQPLTVPASRRFETRYQLTAWNSPVEPRAD